jgi:hypothetical protein
MGRNDPFKPVCVPFKPIQNYSFLSSTNRTSSLSVAPGSIKTRIEEKQELDKAKHRERDRK